MINDNYGHECGDLALIDAGKVLISVFGRENLYRIGGDEFIKGYAMYSPGNDKEYKQVFKRADQKMYANKLAYYNRYGNFRINHVI